jgi:uncharacterized protein (DUF4415 family)
MAKHVRSPTRAEDVEINRGIASDPENPEWTDIDFARARPAKDVLPARLYQAAVKRYRGQRGPQKKPVKKPVTLRLDPDILASYKATGRGWQSRINEVLRHALTDDLFRTGEPRIAENKPFPVQERGKEMYPKVEQKSKLVSKPIRGKAIQKRETT